MNAQGTLLVVDDTPANLKLLADTLTAEGYHVLPADSGELALVAVAAQPPELILLDIRMPGLDGFEVCRRLKARAESRDIPILLISAFGESAERVEGFKLGAVDFITKPFQREELLARIQTHLELRRFRVRLEQQAVDLRWINEQLQTELAERHRSADALVALNQEMQTSRSASVNLMDDAVEARNRLETANQELRREIVERQRAEEDLHREQEFARTLLDNIADGVVACDAQGKLVLFNRAAREWHGMDALALPPEEWGKHYDLFEPDGITPLPTESIPLVRAFRGETVHDAGMAIVAKGQPPRHILATGCPFFDAHHNLLGAVVVMRDFTERKRAEAALRQSEERFRRAIMDSPFPIMLHAEDGTVLQTSNSWCDITGYSREELATIAEWTERAYGERKTLVQADIDHLYSLDHGVAEGDYNIRTKSGDMRIWEFSSAPLGRLPDGRRLVISMAIDVTERRQAEKALVALSSRQEAILAAVPDIIMEVDNHKVYTWANEAGLAFFGDDVIGKEAACYFSGEQTTYQTVQPLFNGYQNLIYVESWQRRKDGEKRLLAWWCRVLKDESGNVTGTLSSARDITEQKRAETALRQSARELQEKNTELARFTYTVSHDLKSPLVTIKTFLGYLEQDTRSPDAARMEKDMGYIRGAADKMARLLGELLDFSRVGRKMNPFVDAPLQAVVQEALDLVAGQIAQREAKVEVTQEPVVLYGDRPRLVELFQNLVDNAVKFMGDQPSPLVEIGAELAGGEIVMFVRDNGMGIDPRYQPKLFELFEKFDSGTEGTGIGLALVKRIVEVHGGRIWAESKGVGKGTTLRFTLAKTQRQPAVT